MVIVGAVLAYVLGGFWYSEKCFAKGWKAGIGTSAIPNMPMAPGMITQAVGTFLLAWVIGVTETTDSLALAILITLTIATLIKANGFFAGKTKYAIFIEASFILAMAVVMILTHAVL